MPTSESCCSVSVLAVCCQIHWHQPIWSACIQLVFMLLVTISMVVMVINNITSQNVWICWVSCHNVMLTKMYVHHKNVCCKPHIHLSYVFCLPPPPPHLSSSCLLLSLSPSLPLSYPLPTPPPTPPFPPSPHPTCLSPTAPSLPLSPSHSLYQTGSRYDGQVLVFGADFQKRLETLKYFLVSTPSLGQLVHGITLSVILYVCITTYITLPRQLGDIWGVINLIFNTETGDIRTYIIAPVVMFYLSSPN